MKIKPGASVENIRPEMVLALQIVDPICKKYNVDSTLTEGTGGKHMVGSLHGLGLAVDIRDKTAEMKPLAPTEIEKLIRELKVALGIDFINNIPSEYQVILEEDHIHIEFQPKRKTP